MSIAMSYILGMKKNENIKCLCIQKKIWYFAALADTFDLFDKNGNGSICKEELGSLLRAVGENPSQREIDFFIKSCDKNSMYYTVYLYIYLFFCLFNVYLIAWYGVSITEDVGGRDRMVVGFTTNYTCAVSAYHL